MAFSGRTGGPNSVLGIPGIQIGVNMEKGGAESFHQDQSPFLLNQMHLEPDWVEEALEVLSFLVLETQILRHSPKDLFCLRGLYSPMLD